MERAQRGAEFSANRVHLCVPEILSNFSISSMFRIVYVTETKQNKANKKHTVLAVSCNRCRDVGSHIEEEPSMEKNGRKPSGGEPSWNCAVESSSGVS